MTSEEEERILYARWEAGEEVRCLFNMSNRLKRQGRVHDAEVARLRALDAQSFAVTLRFLVEGNY